MTRLRSDIRGVHSVIVGEQNTATDPDCENGVCNGERQEILIEGLTPHPSYNTPRYANDIALVRLSQDLEFSGDYVKPVCLPITNELVKKTFTKLIVSGWGTTENSTTSEYLLKASLNVVPIEDCRTAHRIRQLGDDQICAKGKGIVDTCKYVDKVWRSFGVTKPFILLGVTLAGHWYFRPYWALLPVTYNLASCLQVPRGAEWPPTLCLEFTLVYRAT